MEEPEGTGGKGEGDLLPRGHPARIKMIVISVGGHNLVFPPEFFPTSGFLHKQLACRTLLPNYRASTLPSKTSYKVSNA